MSCLSSLLLFSLLFLSLPSFFLFSLSQDARGERTLAVLTKLDLMDEGTDARAIITGSDPNAPRLALGYVVGRRPGSHLKTKHILFLFCIVDVLLPKKRKSILFHRFLDLSCACLCHSIFRES